MIRGGGPERSRAPDDSRSWRSFDRCSSARHLPARAFGAPSRACVVVSDVPRHDPSRTLLAIAGLQSPLAPGRSIRRRRCLVKGLDAVGSGRLPSTNPLSPCRDHGEAVTGLASCMRVALATAIRLPARFRLICSEEQRLDPEPCGSGPNAVRRLLQPKQSTSTTTRSSNPRSSLRARSRTLSRPLAAGDRVTSSCTLVAARRRFPCLRATAARLATIRGERDDDRQPRFHGSEGAAFAASAQPDPLVHLLS